MNCPVCSNETLGVIEHEGQRLHRCINCSGLLVSTGTFKELQRENDRHLDILLEKPAKETNAKNRGARACPQCGTIMKVVDYEWDANIEIDVCQACSLIWLDGGELAQIHEHLKQEHPDLIENELEHETRKFFHWIQYILTRAGQYVPRVG